MLILGIVASAILFVWGVIALCILAGIMEQRAGDKQDGEGDQ